VFHERPQAIGRPLKANFGSAGDDFGLLWLVGLFRGIGRWYLAHHEKAPKTTAAWHGELPNSEQSEEDSDDGVRVA
jgi:hypothetical protein